MARTRRPTEKARASAAAAASASRSKQQRTPASTAVTQPKVMLKMTPKIKKEPVILRLFNKPVVIESSPPPALPDQSSTESPPPSSPPPDYSLPPPPKSFQLFDTQLDTQLEPQQMEPEFEPSIDGSSEHNLGEPTQDLDAPQRMALKALQLERSLYTERAQTPDKRRRIEPQVDSLSESELEVQAPLLKYDSCWRLKSHKGTEIATKRSVCYAYTRTYQQAIEWLKLKLLLSDRIERVRYEAFFDKLPVKKHYYTDLEAAGDFEDVLTCLKAWCADGKTGLQVDITVTIEASDQVGGTQKAQSTRKTATTRQMDSFNDITAALGRGASEATELRLKWHCLQNSCTNNGKFCWWVGADNGSNHCPLTPDIITVWVQDIRENKATIDQPSAVTQNLLSHKRTSKQQSADKSRTKKRSRSTVEAPASTPVPVPATTPYHY
nr:hypothetical protein CFP56_07837 [Quercus suber]